MHHETKKCRLCFLFHCCERNIFPIDAICARIARTVTATNWGDDAFLGFCRFAPEIEGSNPMLYRLTVDASRDEPELQYIAKRFERF